MEHDCPRIKPNVILQAMGSAPLKKGIYVVGCFENRITLRSQQIRALNLMYALDETSQLKKGAKVAIVGGGAAGLTVAAAAARLGFKVTLLEKSHLLMHLQLGAHHRYIHPNIYDWPEPRAKNNDANLPLLNWQANTAHKVRDQIIKKFETLPERKDIEIWYKVSQLACPTTNISWKGEKDSEKNLRIQNNKEFDVLIHAVGFGTELTGKKPEFDCENVSYWTVDSLEQPSVNDGGERLSYLISGCGDGGLIDVLRVRFRDFNQGVIAHQHVEQLCTSNEFSKLREQLLTIEAEARHLFQAEVPRFLHNKYKDLDVPEKIKDAINDNLRRDTSVVLTGKSWSAFSIDSSILNRFLVSLLVNNDEAHTQYMQGPLEKVSKVNGKFWAEIGGQQQGPFENGSYSAWCGSSY